MAKQVLQTVLDIFSRGKQATNEVLSLLVWRHFCHLFIIFSLQCLKGDLTFHYYIEDQPSEGLHGSHKSSQNFNVVTYLGKLERFDSIVVVSFIDHRSA